MQDLLQQATVLDSKDLEARDQEVTMLKRQVGEDEFTISLLQHRVTEADADAAALAADLDAWYHNPLIVGFLGFAGGVTTASILLIASH